MTCTTAPIAHQSMLAHKSESPNVTCTTRLGVIIALVLRSCKDWHYAQVTYESESPNATCTTGLTPTWIQGERVVREVNIHMKDWPWPRAEALTPGCINYERTI